MKNVFNPKAIAKTIDVEELYDLDITIARFILPRLMAYKKHCECTPNLNMTQEEWNGILDKMIYAFDRIACQTEEDTPEYSQGLAQAHQRGPVALPQVLPQPVVVVLD